MYDITYAIPSIPSRRVMLQRAVRSVLEQSVPVSGISVVVDQNKEGAWTARNRAFKHIETEWTGFLDDDDELYAFHTKYLIDQAREHSLDIVWGWFDVIGGTDPFPHCRGRQYDVNDPHIVPITYVVRTELLLDAFHQVGGFHADEDGDWLLQDYPLFDQLHRLGGKSMALDRATWKWYHHRSNTSGLPSRVT